MFVRHKVWSHFTALHSDSRRPVTPWIFQEREKMNLVCWARSLDTMHILCDINIYISFSMEVLMLNNFIESHWKNSIIWVRLFLISSPVVYVCDCPEFSLLHNEDRASQWKKYFRMLLLVPQSGRVAVAQCLKHADCLTLFLKYSIKNFVCMKYVYILLFYMYVIKLKKTNLDFYVYKLHIGAIRCMFIFHLLAFLNINSQ